MIDRFSNDIPKIRTIFSLHKQSMLLAGLLSGTVGLFSQSAHQSMKNGDLAYDRNQYKEAEKEYRAATNLKQDNPTASYNLGNALYQQGNWKDAAAQYDQAAKHSPQKDAKAKALYNLGNALLKQRMFQEATGAYENSLRLLPGDADSKRNLQIAKKLLRQQEEAQKQQQEKQQQKPNEDKQQQNKTETSQNQQNQPSQNQQNQTPKTPSGTPQQPTQSQPGNLKKTDAQRILETAVGPEDQRNARKYRSAQQNAKTKGTIKDW
jgi:tetratricopeptide (TPR) repeat protein